MTRKHPNCRMMIPLSGTDRATLKALARGGSLGDALRRLVQSGLRVGEITIRAEPEPHAASRLPLQLPGKILREVEALALLHGCAPEAVVRALMKTALAEIQIDR